MLSSHHAKLHLSWINLWKKVHYSQLWIKIQLDLQSRNSFIAFKIFTCPRWCYSFDTVESVSHFLCIVFKYINCAEHFTTAFNYIPSSVIHIVKPPFSLQLGKTRDIVIREVGVFGGFRIGMKYNGLDSEVQKPALKKQVFKSLLFSGSLLSWTPTLLLSSSPLSNSFSAEHHMPSKGIKFTPTK